MQRSIPLLFTALISLLVLSSTAQSQTLKVGVKPAPPFAISEGDQWSGISVDLWQQVNQETDIAYEWVYVDSIQQMLAMVSSGELDAAVGALTVTAERERTMDFSHPFFNTGVGVAVSTRPAGWWAAISQLWSLNFLKAVSVLGALLLGVGFLMWLFERKANKEQFGGKNDLEGIGDGFWWSAVTMTTVGYGDKAPVTTAGRALGTVWMFVGVITISSFTAAIASSFTVNSLASSVDSIDDLPKVRVATLANSSAATQLARRGIGFKKVESLAEGLKQLDADTIDALVYDRPLLRYAIEQQQLERIKVLPQLLAKEDYAFALRTGLPLRESINQSILRSQSSGEFTQIKNQYLGGDADL